MDITRLSNAKAALFIVCACIIFPILLLGLPCSVSNYIDHHNVSYVDEDGAVFASKMDGPFSYTQVRYCAATEECSPKGLNVEKNPLFIYKTRIRKYRDIDMDGKVDELGVSIHENYMTLKRERNYRTHREWFDRADNDLKRQKERFRKYLWREGT